MLRVESSKMSHFAKCLQSFVLLNIPRRLRGSTSIDGLFMHSRNPKRKSPFPPSLLSTISRYENPNPAPLPSFTDQQVAETTNKIQTAFCNKVSGNNTGRLFAVVQMLGKQRLVTQEDILILEGHFPADVGERICLEKVLLVGGNDFTVVGRPLLPHGAVRIEATVVEKTVDHSKPVFFQVPKELYRRISFHQSPLCCLRINSISINAELEGASVNS